MTYYLRVVNPEFWKPIDKEKSTNILKKLFKHFNVFSKLKPNLIHNEFNIKNAKKKNNLSFWKTEFINNKFEPSILDIITAIQMTSNNEEGIGTREYILIEESKLKKISTLKQTDGDTKYKNMKRYHFDCMIHSTNDLLLLIKNIYNQINSKKLKEMDIVDIMDNIKALKKSSFEKGLHGNIKTDVNEFFDENIL